MTSESEVIFEQRLCCHANAELLERALQWVLYQRGLVHCPVSDLLAAQQKETAVKENAAPASFRVFVDETRISESSEDGDRTLLDPAVPLQYPDTVPPTPPAPKRGRAAAAEKARFLAGYTALATGLKEAFRSARAGQLAEAVLCLGASPLRPNEVYRFSWEPERELEDVDEACQGAGLPAQAIRALSMALIKSPSPPTSTPPRGLRLWLLIRGRRSAAPPGASLATGFKLPDEEDSRRRKIGLSHFRLVKAANALIFPEEQSEEDWVWFQFPASIPALTAK